jgi:hypothetical protein
MQAPCNATLSTPTGATHGFGWHMNVDGNKAPSMQRSESADAMNPDAHCGVQEFPEAMFGPSAHASPDIKLRTPNGAAHEPAAHTKVEGLNTPAEQFNTLFDGSKPDWH